MELTGKTALVLGGTGGIGKAVALYLLRRGMNVAVNYLDWESRVPSLEKDLARVSPHHLVIKADLTDPDAAVSLADRTASHFNGLHVLVNNVERGGWPVVHGPYTKEQWDLEFAATLRAKRHAFEAALPLLLAQEEGAVVNVSSIAGKVGRCGPASPVFAEGYAAANRGVSALTESWARRAAPTVRVNELSLGFVETRHGPGARGWNLLSEGQRMAITNHTLLRRTGRLDDVARAVGFLLADADFMTGQCLVLDGGFLLGGEPVEEMPAGVIKPGESVLGE
ncbi:MAG: SDR family oxidoreductase [Deltaproteobacteria bacterium]|nr:SDR family oxidoreductase [Deltaproteobacteria bacterium]